MSFNLFKHVVRYLFSRFEKATFSQNERGMTAVFAASDVRIFCPYNRYVATVNWGSGHVARLNLKSVI